MSDHIVDITDDNYPEELHGGLPVLVDFWAPWCGPCRAVAPTIEALADKYSGRVRVTKVNVDENPLLATKFNVRGIPTIGLFSDGKMVDQVVGAAPQEQLEQLIESAL